MTASSSQPAKKLTKGERTAQRLMDVAEKLFAEKGFEGTSLRDVAGAANIREPGIYNHFASKEALYCAVLERGLKPMVDLLDQTTAGSGETRASELPMLMTELLAQHPHMPRLFNRAMMSTEKGAADTLMTQWLERLFSGGLMVFKGESSDLASRRRKALQMAAMFNLCTGYFLSQRILDFADAGDLLEEDNLALQKTLLANMAQWLDN